MKALIRTMSIVMGNIMATIMITAGSVFLLYTGTKNITDSFFVSSIMIGLFPLVMFLLSKLYYHGVTVLLEQANDRVIQGAVQIKGLLALSLGDAAKSGRYVPSIIIMMAILSGTILVPNIIGREMLMMTSFYKQIFGSLAISSQLVFSIYMIKDLDFKKQSLSE